MSTTAVVPDSSTLETHPSETPGTLQAELRRAIEHAAHLLPAQGPITVFIHHNTLHAFENEHFEKAVVRGGRIFGCQPFLFLTTERNRDALNRGRIRFDDLRRVLLTDLGGTADEHILPGLSRLALRLAMLEFPMRTGTAEEIQWCLAETKALRKARPETSSAVRARLISETRRWVMRDLRNWNDRLSRPRWLTELFARFGEARIESWTDETWEVFTLEALWHICLDRVGEMPPRSGPPRLPVRFRDLLLAAASIDIDRVVNDILIRFCAAFLDQGVSHWPLPDRNRGVLRLFLLGLPPGFWPARSLAPRPR
jgi:hypothetical protein